MLAADLRGKKILVTGASRGIGLGIVKKLAGLGASIAWTQTQNSEEALKSAELLNAELKELGASEVLSLSLNLSQTETFSEFFKNIKTQWGGLDVLINNAGIVHDQLMMRFKESDLDRLIDVNFKGTYLLSKESLRYLIKSEKSPTIIFMSSVVSLMGSAGQTAYSATKGAVNSLTKSLALEVASRKIRVNAIAPGFVETDMTRALSEEQRKKIFDAIPLSEIANVDDIAHAAVFLCSDMSRYVTGQVLNVSGGLYV